MRQLTFILFALFFLSACEPTKKTPEIMMITGYAQGTTYSVKYWQDKGEETDIKVLTQSVNNELARIDKLMSNYRDDSDIERFNQQKIANKELPVDQEIMSLLEISAEVYEKSRYCYDPTIKPLFSIWGFSDDKFNLPDDKKINQVLASIGFDKVVRYPTTMLKSFPEVTVDLSAIGQGYAVGKIAELLAAEDINNYLVEIGGEMLVAGTKPNNKPWRVGVERPVPNSQKISEVIDITGKRPTAIMTSGTYRHYFDESGKRYSHILDPRTGKPVAHNSVAVTVLLDDATYADAWSTALLCLGSESGLAVANQYNIPAVFYDLDAKQQVKRLPSLAAKNTNEYWKLDK